MSDTTNPTTIEHPACPTSVHGTKTVERPAFCPSFTTTKKKIISLHLDSSRQNPVVDLPLQSSWHVSPSTLASAHLLVYPDQQPAAHTKHCYLILERGYSQSQVSNCSSKPQGPGLLATLPQRELAYSAQHHSLGVWSGIMASTNWHAEKPDGLNQSSSSTREHAAGESTSPQSSVKGSSIFSSLSSTLVAWPLHPKFVPKVAIMLRSRWQSDRAQLPDALEQATYFNRGMVWLVSRSPWS